MKIQVHSANRQSLVEVEVAGITATQYNQLSTSLINGLATERVAYAAVSRAMVAAVTLCPTANPADLWVHLLYHEFRERAGRTDQSWKRVSGDAFQSVLVDIYGPRLLPMDILLRFSKPIDAEILGLEQSGIGRAKTDLVLEGLHNDQQHIFGVIHCKASLAERMSDDVPASRHIMAQGLWSGLATLDGKMYPPPHGDAVVEGELKHTRNSDKRNYIEVAGQFSGCYSFNKRTPPSTKQTPSGSRIYALGFTDAQPDALVKDIVSAWQRIKATLP